MQMRNHESRTDDEKADEGVFLPAIKKIVSFFLGPKINLARRQRARARSRASKKLEVMTSHRAPSSFFSSDLSSAASFKTEIN